MQFVFPRLSLPFLVGESHNPAGSSGGAPAMPGMPGMAGTTSGAAHSPATSMPGMGGAHQVTGATAHHAAGMVMGPLPVTAHGILTRWQGGLFALAVAVVLVAAAIAYLVGVRRVTQRGRSWPVSRTVCFLLGLVAIEAALGWSVPVYAMSRFTAHIIQHLLLMVVGPPLLALGAPMTLALQTTPRPVKQWLLKALHSRIFGVISHPITVFFLYYLSMYAFFLSPALGYAMNHMWLMDLINLGFLGGATLFWWPMVGLDPIPRWGMNPAFKTVNLLVGIPVEAFLGIALLMKSTTVASMYTLSSTHTGGGVLWAASEAATLIALVPIFIQWSRADERAGRRIDARLDAGQPVTVPRMEGHGLAATLRVLRRD